MPFIDAAVQTMLDSLTVDLLSLHDGHPGEAGTSNELTGGSPAYARTAAVVNAAAGRSRSLNANVTFDVPAGAEVQYIGFWFDSAPDVFHGFAPAGPATNNPQAATADLTGDVIRAESHGRSNDDRVILEPLADALPAGLGDTILYFVVGATADTFQVSLTSGGAAVTITADGDLTYQLVVPETFAGQGQYTAQAGVSLSM